MRKKAVWITAVAPNRLKSQRNELKTLLGKNADLDRFIAEANEAIQFYQTLRRIRRAAPRPNELNAQLARVARHAVALSKALEELDSDLGYRLNERRTRQQRTDSLPSVKALSTLADDATSCRIPVRRGAPINGDLILLTRAIADAYESTTGRRATNYENGPFHQTLLLVFEWASVEASNLAPLYRRALQIKSDFNQG